MSLPDRQTAEKELELGGSLNPGPWIEHSRAVALAAENIARACGMDSERAYIYGLLHDIGRRIGFCGAKHAYAGYVYALDKGWDEIARISLTHSYTLHNTVQGVSAYDGPEDERLFIEKYIAEVEYDDYDRLIQLCDALGNPRGVCIIEKRIVDVLLRHGIQPGLLEKCRKLFELKACFDNLCGTDIYNLLPGIRDNL